MRGVSIISKIPPIKNQTTRKQIDTTHALAVILVTKSPSPLVCGTMMDPVLPAEQKMAIL
jgi:hypothetical protein